MKKFMLTVAAVAVLNAAVLAGNNGKGGKGGNGGNKPNQHQNHNHNNHNHNGIHNFNTHHNHNGIHHLKQSFHGKQYHLTHGYKQHFGFCYKGFNHGHWEHKCWYPKYGCYTYWCPSTCGYYYWCEPDCCWYPVSYCPYGKYAW